MKPGHMFLLLCLVGTVRGEVRGGQDVSPYTITGVAVSVMDGAPVPFCQMHAVVAVVTAGGGRRPVNARTGRRTFGGRRGGGPVGDDLSATADEHGRFRIELPKAAAWTLTGSARGFRSQALDQHEEFSSAVIVTEAEPSVAVRFRMVPDARIRGLVTDEAGEAVAGAQVVAERVNPTTPGLPRPRVQPVAYAQTDDRGMYELGGLEPGRYRVRLQATPWYAVAANRFGAPSPSLVGEIRGPGEVPLDVVYPPLWFPGVTEEERADVLEVRGGEQMVADFHPAPVAAVHLRVPMEGGGVTPGERRPPTLERLDPANGFSVGRGETQGSAGDWVFDGLSGGTYELRLTGAGDDGGGSVRRVQVREGSSGNLDLRGAKALTRVAVTLAGSSEADVQRVVLTEMDSGRQVPVGANQRRGGFGLRVATNSAGGDATVAETPTVSLEGGRRYQVSLGGGRGFFVGGLAVDHGMVTGRTVIVGGEEAKLTVQVGKGLAEVGGVVRDSGNPVAGAMVLLVPASLGQPENLSAPVRDQSNTDGSFLLSDIVPGKYILLAIDKGWDVNWRNPSTLAPYLLRGRALDLKEGATRVDVPAVRP